MWQFATPAKLLDAGAATNIPLTFEVDCSGTTSPLNNSIKYNFNETNDPDDTPGTVWKAVRLDALLTQRFVELMVTCTTSACNTTAIRQINMSNNYPSEQDRYYFMGWLLPHLANAFPIEHINYNGALEAYLYDPTRNSYSVLNQLPGSLKSIADLDTQTLAFRLGQILNTFWIVDQQFNNVAGEFNASDYELVKAHAIKNATIISTIDENIFYCDPTWFALLCLSTLVMLLAAIASPLIEVFQLAPDSTDFLSALTLKGGKDMMEGGTYLNADKRTRLLKDMILKIRDGRPEDDEVGKIVISQEGEVGNLRRGRLYE